MHRFNRTFPNILSYCIFFVSFFLVVDHICQTNNRVSKYWNGLEHLPMLYKGLLIAKSKEKNITQHNSDTGPISNINNKYKIVLVSASGIDITFACPSTLSLLFHSGFDRSTCLIPVICCYFSLVIKSRNLFCYSVFIFVNLSCCAILAIVLTPYSFRMQMIIEPFQF